MASFGTKDVQIRAVSIVARHHSTIACIDACLLASASHALPALPPPQSQTSTIAQRFVALSDLACPLLPFSIIFLPHSDAPVIPSTLSLHTDDIKCCDHHPHEYHPHHVISGLHLLSSTGAPLLKNSTSTPAVPARKRPASCCWTSASPSFFALVPGVSASLCPHRFLRHPMPLLL